VASMVREANKPTILWLCTCEEFIDGSSLGHVENRSSRRIRQPWNALVFHCAFAGVNLHAPMIPASVQVSRGVFK
jgi:hypothetical protein